MSQSMSAIKPAPWNKPLDWDIQVTELGEPRISFAHSVKREQPSSQHGSVLPLDMLPTELQLHILWSCDRPTLWALMRVSSAMRTEAKKLFWSYPDTWYHVDGEWLLTGGYTGQTHCDTDSMALVEQLAIDLESCSTLLFDFERQYWAAGRSPRMPASTLEDRIHDWWQTVQSRFPRATRIIVSEDSYRLTETALPHELDLMLRMHPPVIDVSISIVRAIEDEGYLERRLWRRPDDGNILVDSVGEQHVLLPPKIFRGPVGEWQHHYYQLFRHVGKARATSKILIEARERHQFDGRAEPFQCPKHICGRTFEAPGEWTAHAFQTSHNEDWNGSVPLDEYKDSFERHRSEVKNILEEGVRKAMVRMQIAWGEEESEKRQNAEQTFVHQLEHDPLYAQELPARECSIWEDYLRDMSDAIQ
ncbi:hypothetical protein CC86DRAFT_454155 [Ophiobolus disseminans]|uniref:C2H2-type domain-containing protein n=1 Tax=Ophiobolus disseminans TaxID=1469910 RepID=A0A6A7A6E1_9PLEO|nr:hypothetical protein CC86DRAFT_454155 [Ophiobolus disseminans]